MSLRFIKIFVMVVMVAIFTGCGVARMALIKDDPTAVDVSSSSIVLLPVKISNQYKPEYQPNKLLNAFFTGTEKVSVFIVEDPFKSEKDKYNEYLLSFNLKPGTYTLGRLGCVYSSPLMFAGADIPMNTEFGVKPNTVSYLGHVEVTLRERKNDTEQRAGGFALIDSIGFSGGTFDVSIVDNYDEDMTNYRNEFPALRAVKIEKTMLPSWKRPETKADTK